MFDEAIHNRIQSDRAVSPVIGVILMVAITVILAAVIGAFVLEIGDQQETAPNTSFDSEQTTQFFSDGTDSSNLTVVEISHAGGSTLEVSQNDIKVGGDGSVWAVENRNNGNTDDAYPQPDLRATLGSNDPIEFTSGQTWEAIAYNNGAAVTDDNVESGTDYRFDYTPNGEGVYLTDDSDGSTNSGSFGNQNPLNVMNNSDRVNVVWTASSGGKTQNLFTYTVQ